MYNEEEGLISLLPEVFKINSLQKQDDFLSLYLRTIEKVSFYGDTGKPKGIREKYSRVAELFHPKSALWSNANIFNTFFSANQGDFLAWLGSWFDFIPEEEIDLQKNINVFSELILIYRIRGTVEGLQKACDLFSIGGGQVVITDPEYPQKNNTIAPYTFNILIKLANFNLVKMKEQKATIVRIIEREKPAHVSYTVDFESPSFRIEVQSRVAIDTLIGG